MMINFLEKRGPTISAIIGCVAALAAAWILGMSAVPIAMIATAATIGIVMAGFSATQRNMLFSMRGTRVILRAIKINQMDRVLSYMSKNPYIGIVLTLYSFVGFFIGNNQIVVVAWTAGLGGLVCFALACLARNEAVMSLIVKRYLEERSD